MGSHGVGGACGPPPAQGDCSFIARSHLPLTLFWGSSSESLCFGTPFTFFHQDSYLTVVFLGPIRKALSL